jgi:HAD superfamily hydrolase (TIGR01509 family)
MNTAYIFDLDGTLLDSMEVWANVDVEFLQKRGLVPPDDYSDKISSMGFTECAEYTIKRFNLDDTVDELLQEWNDLAAFAYGNTVQMKPYAKEYLSKLRKRGARLAIATSSMPQLYEPALRNHGIYDWFDVICNSDEVGCGKNRPDVFLLAAERLGVEPKNCLVFEDILAAVKSAKSVDMTVYAVYDRFSHNDWEEIKQIADYAITDFNEVITSERAGVKK